MWLIGSSDRVRTFASCGRRSATGAVEFLCHDESRSAPAGGRPCRRKPSTEPVFSSSGSSAVKWIRGNRGSGPRSGKTSCVRRWKIWRPVALNASTAATTFSLPSSGRRCRPTRRRALLARESRRLSAAHHDAFRRAVEHFVADLEAGQFRAGLRIKGIVGMPGCFEMSWEADGRAIFTYGNDLCRPAMRGALLGTGPESRRMPSRVVRRTGARRPRQG